MKTESSKSRRIEIDRLTPQNGSFMTKSLVIFCEIRFLQVYVTVLEISILKLVNFRTCSPVMLSICLHTF